MYLVSYIRPKYSFIVRLELAESGIPGLPNSRTRARGLGYPTRLSPGANFDIIVNILIKNPILSCLGLVDSTRRRPG